MLPDRPRIYVDTTIVSYLVARPIRDLVAAARREITREWWDGRIDEFEVYVSVTVLDEAGRGDDLLAHRRLEMLRTFHVLELTTDVESLAIRYVDEGIVPSTSVGDAFHLAFASLHTLDTLVTWNFKHLANARVQKRLRDFNDREKLHTPWVCTPEEMLGE